MSDNAFAGMVLLLGSLGIAADLFCGADLRATAAERLGGTWSRIAARNLRATWNRGNDAALIAAQWVLGPGHRPLRFSVRIVVLSMLLALASLAIATQTMDVSWRSTLERALRYYAIPTVVAGACALALLYLFIRWARARGPTWRYVPAVLGLMTGLLVLWLAAMHAGTWHEWQYRRSAVGYGTPWFYAEVYHEYLVKGIGAAVSLALGLTLLLPSGAYAVVVLGALMPRLAAPVLAPATVGVATLLAGSRRGAPSVVILVVMAGLLILARCPSLGTG